MKNNVFIKIKRWVCRPLQRLVSTKLPTEGSYSTVKKKLLLLKVEALEIKASKTICLQEKERLLAFSKCAFLQTKQDEYHL